MARFIAMRCCVWLATAAWASCATLLAAAQEAPPAIDQLIAQLGDDQFTVRRRAEEELLRLGPDAYDQLKLAEDHDDLEISERVRYILERLRIEWIRDADSPDVRRTLARFEDLSEIEKDRRILRLAELKDGEGLAALCRIARLEPSPRVARRAALELVERSNRAFAEPLAKSAAVDSELGTSNREPVEWIRRARAELGAPADPAPWATFAAAESKLLAEQSADSDFATLYRLLRRQLALSLESGSAEQMSATWRQIIELDPRIANGKQRRAGLVLLQERQPGERTQELALAASGIDGLEDYDRFASGPLVRVLEDDNESAQQRLVEAIYFALQWALDERQWTVAETLLANYAHEVDGDRKLLYYAAAVRARAGQAELAQQTADRAFGLKTKTDQDLLAAFLAGELGFVDWAMREYRQVIADSDGPTKASMAAGESLAVWLHDRQDDQGAAEVLDAFNRQISNDLPARQRLIAQLEERNEGAGKALIDALRARRDYYLSFHHQAQGEPDQQRDLLQKAAEAWDGDADILIALYHAPNVDEKLKQRTLKQIEKLSLALHAPIERYPDEAPYRHYKATCYNQWAWLISNTTGDYARAVEYSQRSLQLVPGEASYLDTLGRCYYAAGDLENAVKTQREAVERAPHYGVMRRQLEQFERELAAKKP